MARRRMSAALWALAVLPAVCRAHKLTCSCSEDGPDTTCTISDPDHVLDPDPQDCQFAWLNGTNYAVANWLNGSEQVLNYSINQLTTEGCIEGLHFRRSCVSEGMPMTADCNTNCSVIGPQNENGGDFPDWGIVLLIIMLLLLLLLLGIVAYCCRDKLPRIDNCWKARGSYSCVQKKSSSSEVVMEEP